MTRTYPNYCESGLPFIGRIPCHWAIKPALSVAREREEPNAGLKENNLLSLSYGRIVRKDIEGVDGLLPASFETYQIVHAGDLVLRLTDLQNDKRSLRTAMAEETGIITSAYLALAPSAVDPRFLAYLFRAYDITKVFYSMGGGLRQSMKFSDIKRLPVLLPPHSEQRAIAAFLDRETGKIDALVEEQRRLIALLKEKRQAVISHAVTKGVDAAAPMKPSGIDWLGDIPAHWTCGRLKHDLAFLTSGSRGWASHYADEGSLFIRIGNLTRDTLDLNLDDIQRVDVPAGIEGQRTRVQGGDLLFSITAYLGSVAVVPDDLETAYVSQHVALARLRRERLLPEWAGLVTLSDVGKSYLAAQGYGGTKIQLALDDVANITMPMPPLDEQGATVDYLDQELRRVSSLISEAEAGIALLQERRAALISAAVTGKIDVREDAAKATEAA